MFLRIRHPDKEQNILKKTGFVLNFRMKNTNGF